MLYLLLAVQAAVFVYFFGLAIYRFCSDEIDIIEMIVRFFACGAAWAIASVFWTSAQFHMGKVKR